MIVEDQKLATFVATATLALGLAVACSGAAGAVESPLASPAPASEAQPVSVTLVENGVDVHLSTGARTVGALLDERNDRLEPGDTVTPAAIEPLADGMQVVYRQAVPVDILSGGQKVTVRSSAATVGDLLAEQHVAVAPGDEVSPAASKPFTAHDIVRIVHVSSWLAHVRQAIAAGITRRADAHLAPGTTRVAERGVPGVREMTVRFVKRGDGPPERIVLETHVVRAPRATIVVRGVAAYQSLAHVAAAGFASAMHFAGSALHMIATAYTAGCYGCTGMTASGVRAGFGVIAVDPSVIPLGTKLFIPGYGRAVAGDTGGAIRGNRIDLGFNSNGEAMQWGNRAVTVYRLR